MVIIMNEKFNQNIEVWDTLLQTKEAKNNKEILLKNRNKLSSFFKKLFEFILIELKQFCVKKSSNTNETEEWSMYLREQFLLFLINCNYTFENDIVRLFMVKIVGIPIWLYLHPDQRALLLNNTLERSYQKKWKRCMCARIR